MKEKIKKFMNNNMVKTIGIVIFVGAAAYVGGLYGSNKSIEGHEVLVKFDGYEMVKIEDKIEDSVEEA